MTTGPVTAAPNGIGQWTVTRARPEPIDRQEKRQLALPHDTHLKIEGPRFPGDGPQASLVLMAGGWRETRSLDELQAFALAEFPARLRDIADAIERAGQRETPAEPPPLRVVEGPLLPGPGEPPLGPPDLLMLDDDLEGALSV